ncbi:hypothetical protein GLYMA_20G047700v4 [Glycine max]|uniref:uncharacterized protein isoform X3 n=1 Tax=Glycine max TaxID=3847 RepID=UPI0003DE9803|nr:uncharacterized protein LOC102668444 isoform X3 [Glycine max]KAG4394482.1 hypothetical protein GLYMA_20G047700v4 [Glycine max]KAG4394486.1 hypothetical protein GLYMA_20G047700v4 [Glycine max]KAH1034539.1 hypothetical protein GYH30_054811 [Glycine max]KAH1034544.1 hypothetical protein GYH30_054811 [Glycine max]|eukprot:XP_006605626.1 uncharacterized protein LOC102668444 isoform X3 [Glycine max]
MITVFFPHFWLPLCIVSHPLPIIGIWFVVAIWIVVVLFNSNDILRKQSALKVQRERKMLVLESLGLMALSPALTIMLGFVIYENRTSGLYIEKKQVKFKGDTEELTLDGSVDWHGRPIIRAKSSRWVIGTIVLCMFQK